MPQDER